MTRIPFLIVPVVVGGFVAMTLTAQAQSPSSVPPAQPAAGRQMAGQMSGMPLQDTQMMTMHETMMADMKAMDVKLDALVITMNAAKGEAKVNAIADALTALVAQHKTMHGGMMQMQGQMMMQPQVAMPMPMGAK